MNKEYKVGFVKGYDKGYKDAMAKKSNIIKCKDCKWWSKSKLKCYRPYANRQSNSNSFCDKGIRKNVQ